MTRVSRPAVLALTLTVGVLLGACSATQPAAGSASTIRADANGGIVANTPTIFSNSVPEIPWWDKVEHTVTPPAPTTLSWTLSGDILFDSGSATLSPSARSQLSGILATAQQHCAATITVLGYTDSVPDPTFPGGNQGLSVARADAVANVIGAANIYGDHVHAEGEGTSNPVGDNTTTSGRQANRRVVIKLSAPAASCPTSSTTSTAAG